MLIPMSDEGLGQLIRAARLRKGWTQGDLAEAIGVDRAYISQLETSGRKWPKTHIQSLSKVLGLTELEMAVAAGLINPVETETKTDTTSDDPLLNVVMHDARNLTPEGLEALRDIVRGLLKMQERSGGE